MAWLSRNLDFYVVIVVLLEYNDHEPNGQLTPLGSTIYIHGIPVVSVAATEHGLRNHLDICRENRHVETSVFLALAVVVIGNRAGSGVDHNRTIPTAGW